MAGDRITEEELQALDQLATTIYSWHDFDIDNAHLIHSLQQKLKDRVSQRTRQEAFDYAFNAGIMAAANLMAKTGEQAIATYSGVNQGYSYAIANFCNEMSKSILKLKSGG